MFYFFTQAETFQSLRITELKALTLILLSLENNG